MSRPESAAIPSVSSEALLKRVQANLDSLEGDARGEAEKLLRELSEAFERNPLERFVPMPVQAEFLGLDAKVRGYMGGNRAGKTTVGVVDDLIQACDREALPSRLRVFKRWEPPFYCRIVTPDFTSTMEGVIFQKLREWCPRGQLRGGSWDKAYDKQLRKLHFANGSWFDFLTYEQDLDKFGGAALHRVHFDEEPPGEKGRLIYNESRMRLIDYGGEVVFTMTPLLGISWTFDEVWERRLEPGFGVVQASTFDNVHLPREEIEEATRGLTEEEKKARLEGRFVHFGGLVFPEFSDEKLTSVTPERLRGQQVVVGIDPGIRWHGVVFVAFDNDNSAVVFDELLLENHTVPMAAQRIKEKLAKWGVRKQVFVIDPSARNRNAVNAEQVEGAYHREGIHVMPGQNALEAGVFEVKRRLQGGMLSVDRECTRLVWEFGRYRVDEKPDGFAVVKENDHCLDALRYALMLRPWNVADRPVMERRHRGWIPDVEDKWVPVRREQSPPMGALS